MAKYAEKTQVSSIKSRQEIEATLMRYGATRFAYMTSEDGAQIGFVIGDRNIRFRLPLPDRRGKEFTEYKRGAWGTIYQRSEDQAAALYEQAIRQRWRALALVIKAKLEAVSAGITTVEDEFLAHTVLPGGETVGEWMKPQIALAYQTGDMPLLLTHQGG